MMLLIYAFSCSLQNTDSAEIEPEVIPFWAPDEAGPFDAGLHSFSFTSPHGRELNVDVWYPAQRREIESLAEYEPFSFRGSAFRDPPMAITDTPLIAFSHGLMSVRFQNFRLCEHLAQHGFTVLAPDHPGTHIFDIGYDIKAADVFVRPDDIRHSVDYFLNRMAEADHPLHNLVQSEYYIAMGHSLGSHTAMTLGGAQYDLEFFKEYCILHPNERACKIAGDIEEGDLEIFGREDSRVYATIPMSPGFWYTFGSGLTHLRDPFFVIGQLDQVLEYDSEAIPTLEYLSRPPNTLTFHHTGHYGFTEMCALIPAFSEECTDESGAYTDPEILHEALNGIILAHLLWDETNDPRYRDWLVGQEWPSSLLSLEWYE